MKQSINSFLSFTWINGKLKEWEVWGWKDKMHTGKDRKREKINRWKSHVWSWRCEGKKTRWCLKAAFWTVVLKPSTRCFWSGRLDCLVLCIFFSIGYCPYCSVLCISYLCFNTFLANCGTVIANCCTDGIRAALWLGPAQTPVLDSPVCVFVFLLYILKWNQQRMELSLVGLWGSSAISVGRVPFSCCFAHWLVKMESSCHKKKITKTLALARKSSHLVQNKNVGLKLGWKMWRGDLLPGWQSLPCPCSCPMDSCPGPGLLPGQAAQWSS